MAKAQEERPVIPEATYSSSRFGISFRIPANYSLLQGQGVAARSGDFGLVPGDSGEYLFAKLEPAGRNFPYPIFAPSTAALYFGIHLGINEEVCLAPLDFPGYKSKGTLVANGVTFRWSADLALPDTPRFPARPMRYPFGEEHFRDYAGFANSVCYEFHLRARADSRENHLPELEAVLSTIEIFPRSPAPRQIPGQPELPFPVPDEIFGLMKLASWQISYPRSFRFPHLTAPPFTERGQGPPEQLFPVGPDLSQFNAITLTYVSPLADEEAATALITKLMQEMRVYLEGHQWAPVRSAGNPVGASTSGTYKKGDAHLDFGVGTGRCTMNTPCTQLDSLTITVYLPAGST